MVDLPAIRKAASEAYAVDGSTPDEDGSLYWTREGTIPFGKEPMVVTSHCAEWRKFIALCNPATVLAMVKVCEAVRALTPGDSTLPDVDGFVPVPFDRFLALSDALRALTGGVD